MSQNSGDMSEMADAPDAGFRLSPQQQRLRKLREASSAYRVSCAVEIDGPLDGARLEEAIHQVTEAHDILRATFVSEPQSAVSPGPINSGPSSNGGVRPLLAQQDNGVVGALLAAPSESALGAASSAPTPETAHPHHLTKSLSSHQTTAFGVRTDVRPQAPSGGIDSAGLDDSSGPLRWQLVRLGDAKHQLLLDLSPLCGDAATLGLLVQSIASTYAAVLGAGSFAYEGLQYSRFAAWQNELIETPDAMLDEAHAYWASRALQAPEPGLPLRRELPRFAVFTPDSVSARVEADLCAAIAAAASRLDVTESELLLAAWYAFLWRWRQGAAAAVGYLSDGRTYEELKCVMGLFARCLPIHAEIAGIMPFNSLAASVHTGLTEALDWQDYFLFAPASNDADSTHEAPALTFEYEARTAPQAVGGLVWSICRQEVLIEPFQLKLGFIREGAALTVELHYDSSLYDRPDVERALQGFLALTREAAGNPELRIDRLPLLGEEERAELCIRFNATERPYPDSRCLHELFEEQALRTPDAVAVRLGTKQLTYRELDARAGKLAGCLQAFGVGPETRVAICLTRSPDLVVAILGVLKAGGAYVPLDASYPLERLAQILEDAAPAVVLTQTDLSDRLPGSSTPIVCLDSDAALIDSMEFDPAVGVRPDNLAYVIYTSGSTGRPKGVMIPHRGLVNYLHWAAHAYRVTEGAGTLVDTPVGFDLTITSLLSPLLVGQTAALVPEQDGLEGLVSALQVERDVTLVKTTPSYLEVLRNLLPAEAAGASRLFVIGGEALRWDTLSFWKSNAPTTRLVNEYGPTETVVGCCVYEVPGESGSGGSVPIGRPIANTRLYLLDSGMQPAPMGMPGELYVGGAGVARGYLDHPDMTAERFVPDPFSQEPGARLYRTGDLCRYRPDGNLEYMDRADNQVKIRGFRIELGEIEGVLTQHPQVGEAAVVAREDQPGDRRLIAYIVRREGASGEALNVTELRHYLQERLPEYMAPSTLVLLEALPLTTHGKVDRKALHALGADDRAGETAYTPPSTPLEEGLADIWSEVLRIERIGIHDNFFELGGHSLTVTQVIARVRDTFQADLAVRSLFDAPTVASLAQLMLLDPETRPQIERLAELLASLSRLSDEELAERLSNANPIGGSP